MRAVRFHEYGSADVLRLEDIETRRDLDAARVAIAVERKSDHETARLECFSAADDLRNRRAFSRAMARPSALVPAPCGRNV